MLLATYPFTGADFENTVYVNQDGDATLTGKSLSPAGDFDGYRLFWDDPGAVVVETSGTTDTRLAYYDGSGSPDLTDDDGGSGTNARISTNITANTELGFGVRGFDSATTGDYGLSVNGPAHIGTNDIAIDANRQGTDSGNVFGTWDYRFFEFTTTAAGDWTVTVDPVTTLDPMLIVYNSGGNPVGGSFTSPIDVGGSGTNETHTLTGLASGQTFFLRVDGFGSSTGEYTIEVQGPAGIPPDAFEPNDSSGRTRSPVPTKNASAQW